MRRLGGKGQLELWGPGASGPHLAGCQEPPGSGSCLESRTRPCSTSQLLPTRNRNIAARGGSWCTRLLPRPPWQQLVKLPACQKTKQLLKYSHYVPSFEPPPAARIEDMRRSIGVTTSTSGADELTLTELIGEGAWRRSAAQR